MRRFAFVLLVLAAACKKPSTGDATRDWFEDHRLGMTHVRDLLREDGGLVTSVQMTQGGLVAGVTGSKNHCGSTQLGGEFPWKCTSGPDVGNVPETEVALGLPPGRLRQYSRAITAKRVDLDDPCIGPGTVRFTAVDAEQAEACDGLRNVVASSSVPVWNETVCPTLAHVVYEAISPGGWYAERCRP